MIVRGVAGILAAGTATGAVVWAAFQFDQPMPFWLIVAAALFGLGAAWLAIGSGEA